MQTFAKTPRSCVELYTRAHAEGGEEDEVEEEDEEGPELDSSGDEIPAPVKEKRRRPFSRRAIYFGCNLFWVQFILDVVYSRLSLTSQSLV